MILENLKVSAKTGFHNYRINTLLLVVLNEKSPLGLGGSADRALDWPAVFGGTGFGVSHQKGALFQQRLSRVSHSTI
jgi:hypothetical protein